MGRMAVDILMWASSRWQAYRTSLTPSTLPASNTRLVTILSLRPHCQRTQPSTQCALLSILLSTLQTWIQIIQTASTSAQGHRCKYLALHMRDPAPLTPWARTSTHTVVHIPHISRWVGPHRPVALQSTISDRPRRPADLQTTDLCPTWICSTYPTTSKLHQLQT